MRVAAEQKLIKAVGDQDASLFLYTTNSEKPVAVAGKEQKGGAQDGQKSKQQ